MRNFINVREQVFLHRQQAPGDCLTVSTNRCRDLILIRIPVTIYFVGNAIKISVSVVIHVTLTKHMPPVHPTTRHIQRIE